MHSTHPITVVIADDHQLFLDGFELLLKKDPSINIIAKAYSGNQLLDKVKIHAPDIVITDIQMPEMDGIEATKKITKEFPDTNVIALSMYDDDHLVLDMFEAGAKGYLLKNTSKEEALTAIKTIYEGGIYFPIDTSKKLLKKIITKKTNQPAEADLSDKELDILKMICKQYSSKEIAGRLNMTNRSVESIQERLQKKTGARNMAGLVIYAIQKGIYKP